MKDIKGKEIKLNDILLVNDITFKRVIFRDNMLKTLDRDGNISVIGSEKIEVVMAGAVKRIILEKAIVKMLKKNQQDYVNIQEMIDTPEWVATLSAMEDYGAVRPILLSEFALLSKDDKDGIHEVLSQMGKIGLEDDYSVEEYFYHLPDSVRKEGIRWGYQDSVVRDLMYVVFKEVKL